MISLIRKLFSRKRLQSIDRNIELQDLNEVLPKQAVPIAQAESIPKQQNKPSIVHFDGREQAIERGYWLSRSPRRIKKCNVEIETLLEPGELRRLNRLVKRGYYRSLRHLI